MSNINLYHDVISDCISSATIKLGGVLGMRLHIILACIHVHLNLLLHVSRFS